MDPTLLNPQIKRAHSSWQQVTAEIEKACEAAKAHELLTARILRFCKLANDLGIETEDIQHGAGGICFGIERAANLSLGKLRGPNSSTYFPEKSWQHPTDEAFDELLILLTPTPTVF